MYLVIVLKEMNMTRTFYFDNLFTRSEDDRETIDELIDSGFPGHTEVDLVDTTYKNEYLTAGEEGVVLGLSNRIHDLPSRRDELGIPKRKPSPKVPSLELGKIIVGPGEHFWKVHDFNSKTMLITLFDIDTKEWKDITLTELQKDFIDPDC